jgi:hypothetical protein
VPGAVHLPALLDHEMCLSHDFWRAKLAAHQLYASILSGRCGLVNDSSNASASRLALEASSESSPGPQNGQPGAIFPLSDLPTVLLNAERVSFKFFENLSIRLS